VLWKDKYALGVPVVDTQHKELFQRVESFVKTLRSPSAWEERVLRVNETLEFMKAYVVEHFNDEEAYQLRIGYPGYQSHKKVHDDMVAYVLAVSAQYEHSGYDEKLMQQFAGKLLAWLINHVAAEDQRIADYAIAKGVSGNAN
jgi:hemerythrin